MAIGAYSRAQTRLSVVLICGMGISLCLGVLAYFLLEPLIQNKRNSNTTEWIASSVSMEVSTDGTVTITELRSLKVNGEKVIGGFCPTYPQLLTGDQPRSNAPATTQEVIEVKSLSEGVPAYTTGVLHGVKVCLGRIGTPLKPGVYQLQVKRRLLNLVRAEGDRNYIRFIFRGPKDIPLKSQEVQIVFPTVFKGAVRDRMLAHEHLKIDARLFLEGEQITLEEYQRRKSNGELNGSAKDVAVEVKYDREKEATVGSIRTVRNLELGEMVLLYASWPVRMYTEVGEISPAPAPTK